MRRTRAVGDERFGTAPAAASPAVQGKSSGGYGALVLAMLRSDVWPPAARSILGQRPCHIDIGFRCDAPGRALTCPISTPCLTHTHQPQSCGSPPLSLLERPRRRRPRAVRAEWAGACISARGASRRAEHVTTLRGRRQLAANGRPQRQGRRRAGGLVSRGCTTVNPARPNPARDIRPTRRTIRAGWTTGTKRLRPSLSSM
jgi:hypothetical protein